MCSVSSETVLDFAELRCVGVQCLKCDGLTIFDLADTRQQPPAGCPTCNAVFDTVGVVSQLDSLRNLYRVITTPTQKTKITIRVRAPLSAHA
jgi:hypothetical protein